MGQWKIDGYPQKARVKGLGRRVKRYIAQHENCAFIPNHERPNDSTLTEWIRHNKRDRLNEQGKLLYEKGELNPDNLPDEAMVNVEGIIRFVHACWREIMTKGKGNLIQF